MGFGVGKCPLLELPPAEWIYSLYQRTSASPAVTQIQSPAWFLNSLSFLGYFFMRQRPLLPLWTPIIRLSPFRLPPDYLIFIISPSSPVRSGQSLCRYFFSLSAFRQAFRANCRTVPWPWDSLRHLRVASAPPSHDTRSQTIAREFLTSSFSPSPVPFFWVLKLPFFVLFDRLKCILSSGFLLFFSLMVW